MLIKKIMSLISNKLKHIKFFGDLQPGDRIELWFIKLNKDLYGIVKDINNDNILVNLYEKSNDQLYDQRSYSVYLQSTSVILNKKTNPVLISVREITEGLKTYTLSRL